MNFHIHCWKTVKKINDAKYQECRCKDRRITNSTGIAYSDGRIISFPFKGFQPFDYVWLEDDLSEEGDGIMDEPIKCECGNDKFWWFGELLRCLKCFNEYKRTGNGKEYWMRRFNKEENHYPENWEHFNPRSFQQISDKGLESLSKDDSIVGNPIGYFGWKHFSEEKKDYSFLNDKGILNPHITGQWRAFWHDRWLFEERLKQVIDSIRLKKYIKRLEDSNSKPQKYLKRRLIVK